MRIIKKIRRNGSLSRFSWILTFDFVSELCLQRLGSMGNDKFLYAIELEIVAVAPCLSLYLHPLLFYFSIIYRRSKYWDKIKLLAKLL